MPPPSMAFAIDAPISQSDRPVDETACANWPLEDMRPDTVKRWASRIVAAYPAVLVIAVMIGLATGYVGGENAQLVLTVEVFLLFPIYILGDAIFNARFLACALRACILPIGALWAYGIFDENIKPVVWLIVAAAYLAVAIPTIAITRWHRASMFGAGNVGLSKWGPKIAYIYLMVILIFFIYDEAAIK